MSWRCWIFGHQDTAPFVTDRQTFSVRCSECHRITDGIALAKSVVLFPARQQADDAESTRLAAYDARVRR